MRIVLWLFLIGCVHAKGVTLQFAGKLPQKVYYSLKSTSEASMVDPDHIRSFREEMKGMYTQEVDSKPDADGYNASRNFVVKEYRLNDEDIEVPAHLANSLSYRFELDPLLGVRQKSINPAYDPQDILEMNVVLPSGPVAVGSTWTAPYHANLAFANQSRIRLAGKWRLKSLENNTAVITGKFEAKVEPTSSFRYAGVVRMAAEYQLFVDTGIVGWGKYLMEVRVESRSEVAKLYKDTVKDGSRLGYRMKFVSEIRPISEAEALLQMPVYGVESVDLEENSEQE